ncbi:MAG: GNAT family N-acetyltransferase [Nocardioidaceae bacterium]
MDRLVLRPFTQSDLGAAGRLLAERHRLHRLTQPHLSARYESPDSAEVDVTEVWKADHVSGAVAVRNGEVNGFLLGAPKPGEVWGPNVWVEAAGQAVAEAEVMRDLYALAATRWVEEGRDAHHVVVPAHDEALVRSWFRLGFGQQQMHGIRDVPTGPRHAPPPGMSIRRARRDDIPVLAELDRELPLHQGLAPTFSAGTVATLEEYTEEWEEDWEDEEFATFVADCDGQVIGSAVGCAIEKSNSHKGLARPDSAGLLGFAAVLPSARGLGAGRALGEAVLAWAAEQGFDSVVTDWRATNLTSSRAWPALGFTETFLRLHRLIRY